MDSILRSSRSESVEAATVIRADLNPVRVSALRALSSTLEGSPTNWMATPYKSVSLVEKGLKPLAGQKRIHVLKAVSEEVDLPSGKRGCVEGVEDKPAHGGAGKESATCEDSKRASRGPTLLVEDLPERLSERSKCVEKKSQAAASAFCRVYKTEAAPALEGKVDLRSTSQRIRDVIASHASRSWLPTIMLIEGRNALTRVAVISNEEAYILKRKCPIGKGGFKTLYKVKEVFSKAVAATYTGELLNKVHESEISLMERMKGVEGVVQLRSVVQYVRRDGVFMAQVILPYYNLGSLGDLIEEPERVIDGEGNCGLSIEIKKELTRQIVLGLVNMHSMGYIHRDLKPANILIDYTEDRWTAVVGDLGLAVHKDDTLEKKRFVGTEGWDAPETRKLAKSRFFPKDFSLVSTFESDIYALGLILYVFFARDSVDVSPSFDPLILNMDESHKGVPADIQNLIKGMLSKDPSKRTWERVEPLLDVAGLGWADLDETAKTEE